MGIIQYSYCKNYLISYGYDHGLENYTAKCRLYFKTSFLCCQMLRTHIIHVNCGVQSFVIELHMGNKIDYRTMITGVFVLGTPFSHRQHYINDDLRVDSGMFTLWDHQVVREHDVLIFNDCPRFVFP